MPGAMKPKMISGITKLRKVPKIWLKVANARIGHSTSAEQQIAPTDADHDARDQSDNKGDPVPNTPAGFMRETPG